MKEVWIDGSGNVIEKILMMNEIQEYVSVGGKVFVGTDSQLKADSCVFVTAICLHKDKGRKYSKYFFKRNKIERISHNQLYKRIMKEVQRSIDVSFQIMEKNPDADIEVHVDVGLTKRSETRKFADSISGWIKSSGFEYKMKPDSWASSSVADWHTK